MTLGAAAVITPLHIADASLLHLPMLGMLAADAFVLLGGYVLFLAVAAGS